MSETLIPTHALRLLQSSRDEINPPVLQQMFVIPGNGRQIWRDVPIVCDAPAPRPDAPTAQIKELSSNGGREGV